MTKGNSSDGAGQKPQGIWIKTFGCQMNEYDSEKVLALLSDTHRTVDLPEHADFVFINTCSVREKAAHKLYSLLGTFSEFKKNNPNLVIGVGGCVAQQDGKSIAERSSEVDFVVGTHNLSLIPKLIAQTRADRRVQVAVDYREEWEELPDEFNALPEGAGHFQSASRSSVRALVAIQRGCNKNCSFCVVPTTRGPQVSRSAEEILKEIRLKVRLGAVEVLLLGQTVNSYGLDLQPRIRFEELIRQIAKIDGLKRIRFTSPHPAEVRPSFIDLYGEVPELCPQIHLPLQSGSNRILKLMNRNYKVERYLEIVEGLQARVPGIALTSDIIVGFPTESDADFQATLDVMRQVKYTSTFSFKYSPRPNTVALSGFSAAEAVDPLLAQERLSELQSLQAEHTEGYHRKFHGRSVQVLVERRNKKISSQLQGRTPENILVQLSGCNAEIGEIVEARITSSSPHTLRSEFGEEIFNQTLDSNGVEKVSHV